MPLFLLHVGQQDVRFCKLRIQLQRLPGRADLLWPRFTRANADKNRTEMVVRFGQADVSWCKRRVLPDRLLKVSNTLFGLSPAVACGELPLEIALINFGRDMTRSDKPGALLPRDGNFHLASDGLCHLPLQRNDVTRFAVVGLAPKVLADHPAHQFGTPAHPPTLPYYPP